MAAQEPGYVGRLFTGLVPDDVIVGYKKLLAVGGVAKEEAEQFLGDAGLVDELSARGMAHALPHTPSAPATFQPASPELALLGVLADLQATLSRQQKTLLDGHRRLADARSQPEVVLGGVPEHLVKVITDRDEVLRVTMHLINSAHRDWMTLETHETDMPLTDDYSVDDPLALQQQVRIRSIYDTALTEHPVASRCIERFVAAGEEARILPVVPMKMQLADKAAVLLPLTSTGAAGALLIRAAPITHAMRDFFEMLWARATPFGGSPGGSPLTATERRILQLMAMGKQDSAIAASMDMSESTVRRHIRVITGQLGLKTPSRFALGLAVGRRGWLTAARETQSQADKETPTHKEGHA
jgi:DNA-binding CsgD family transcriptional regulator